VRLFDPALPHPPPSLPAGVSVVRYGLGGENTVEDGRKIGTLSYLESIRQDQGRKLFSMKWDCDDGCEWTAAAQILRDHGPLGLQDFEHFKVRLDFKARTYTPRRGAALAALLYNADLRLYWRRLGSNSVGVSGSEYLLGELKHMLGSHKADTFRASRANFDRYKKINAAWPKQPALEESGVLSEHYVAFYSYRVSSPPSTIGGVEMRWKEEEVCSHESH
jgi:hypothetical protein